MRIIVLNILRGVFILLPLLYKGVCVYAQDLPEQMHFSEDGEQLLLGGVAALDFYELGKIRDLYLDFEDPDFWQFMKDNYGKDVYALATLRYEDLVLDSVGVAFKGQTSYTQAVQSGTEKLSFSVKLDLHVEGQDIDGFNNLNFNNAYQDESFMIEVLYANLSMEHVPALRGNFVHLYLNGEDWGIYPNIQQVNGDFIKAWYPDKDGIRWRADSEGSTPAAEPGPGGGGGGGGQWGDGTAALNYLGEDTATYQRYYTLKDSDMDDPWTRLVRVCRVLNETADDLLTDSLAPLLNIDATLWFLAQEILFSDDDSYIYKGKMDYYLYLEESTGLLTPLEFDGNSAMSLRNVSWSPFLNEDDENYPLLNRLLEIPELRQRYIAHVKTLMGTACDPAVYNSLIDELSALIREEVINDPKSAVTATVYDDAVANLRTFLNRRRNIILNNAEFSGNGPQIEIPIRSVEGLEGAVPANDQDCSISVEVSHADGLSAVYLYYGTGLNGHFTRIEMQGDGVYTATIPGQAGGSMVRYYIEALAADEAQSASYLPAGAAYDVFAYITGSGEGGEGDLVINEFLASNNSTIPDEAGEYDDWVEIHNRSAMELSLEGCYLSDDGFDPLKWPLPDTLLEPGAYMVIWTDDDEEQGSLHASFKLSADGESLILSDSTGNVIDIHTFGVQSPDISTGRWPDATGPFQTMEPTFQAENMLFVTGIGDETAGDATQEDGLLLYPNPSSGIVYMKLPDRYATSSSPVCIYDTRGQLLRQEVFSGSIDLSDLAPGLYIIRVGTSSGMLQKQ